MVLPQLTFISDERLGKYSDKVKNGIIIFIVNTTIGICYFSTKPFKTNTMKKLIFIIAMFFSISIISVSCEKEDDTNTEKLKDGTPSSPGY